MRMSPRPAQPLPPAVAHALLELQARAAETQAALRAAVRDALTRGSVRQVAATLGISPTTVQAWSRDG